MVADEGGVAAVGASSFAGVHWLAGGELINLGANVSVKVVAAINGMTKQGHAAHMCRHKGEVWVEIDHCMLASFREIEELVDGVHSFDKLADVFRERHAKEVRSE